MAADYWSLALRLCNMMCLLGFVTGVSVAQVDSSECHARIAEQTIREMARIQYLWGRMDDIHRQGDGPERTCIERKHDLDWMTLPRNAFESREVFRIDAAGLVAIECWNSYSPEAPAFAAAYGRDGEVYWLRGFPQSDWRDLYGRLDPALDSAAMLEVAQLYLRTVTGDMYGLVHIIGIDTVGGFAGVAREPRVQMSSGVTEIELYTHFVNTNQVHRHGIEIRADGEVKYRREEVPR